ncbi:hypothetical protein F3Y22_tig00000778pilonHSYRG00250 [Hibiscus syriacus]|uniref:Tubby C-terminal domain-containing protein n=1 Tax=Hibiscus syriacus TaxID=106335 RepID=A0A6A3D2V6_HIBSY|nr:hypothetical protein F3Y22_tig00000778pilonHSYRG00250 [Hibiscus syriacus]
MAKNNHSRLPNYPVAHISYELDVFGLRGPRRMQCTMETIPATSIAPEGAARTRAELSRCSTNAPRWDERLRCWRLNFRGRVTVASVKNFQLVDSPENRKIILQFGKVGKFIHHGLPVSDLRIRSICYLPRQLRH